MVRYWPAKESSPSSPMALERTARRIPGPRISSSRAAAASISPDTAWGSGARRMAAWISSAAAAMEAGSSGAMPRRMLAMVS